MYKLPVGQALDSKKNLEPEKDWERGLRIVFQEGGGGQIPIQPESDNFWLKGRAYLKYLIPGTDPDPQHSGN